MAQHVQQAAHLQGHPRAPRDPRLRHPEAPVGGEREARGEHGGEQFGECLGHAEGPVLDVDRTHPRERLGQHDRLAWRPT
eukprot:3258516-Pyramimonas_sp.AAC.1